MQKFNRNIAIIDSLNISFYEKDSIRSAYYNHINNIPESREQKEILSKYFIVFRNGDIVFRNGNVITAFTKKQEIENRKRLYKQSIKEKNDLYNKDFLKEKISPKDTQSSVITQTIQNAQAIFNESETFLKRSEDILNECFTKEELSYGMIKNIIDRTNENLKSSINVLNDFLNPFMDFFDGLQADSQKEILKKANSFIEKLQTEKNISVNLCIKLSSIKAHNALKKESVFIDYLKETIQSLNGYMG